MAQIAVNTTVTNTGAREDLADTITIISPQETPLYSNIGKNQATAINHEWQTDTLANATINSHQEGESIVVSTAAQTTRLGNLCQISTTSYGVSGTLRAITNAGTPDRLNFLRMKKGLELRRDCEIVLHTNQAKVSDTGGSSTRQLGGLPTWITNNVGVDVSAGNGDGSSAIRSSGATAITYELISSAQQLAYEKGGNPDIIELSPILKRKWSLLAFGTAPSTAQIRYNIDKTGMSIAYGAVEKWQSDFGMLDIIPNRHFKNTAGTFLNGAAFLLETEKLAVATLPGRNFIVQKLAKTGDGDQEFILNEYTLEVKAPTAHAAAYGLT
jgi:hypothetical protein